MSERERERERGKKVIRKRKSDFLSSRELKRKLESATLTKKYRPIDQT